MVEKEARNDFVSPFVDWKKLCGAFFQLPKMLHTSPVITLCFLYLRPNYFSSEMCSLLMFYIFCMDIGGYFFVSSLDRILEPELTGLQGFDRCSQIKCVVGNSRKKVFLEFSSNFSARWCYGVMSCCAAHFKFCKAGPKMRRESNFVVFIFLEIIFLLCV